MTPSRSTLSILIILIAQIISSVCTAGVFEISAMGNYRKTFFDATHTTTMESGTASLGYYFWELSALEFSYTQGVAEQIQPEYKAYQTLSAYGVNLVITMANKDSAFKPYIKGGAAYQSKDLLYIIPTFPSIKKHTEGVVPTAGLGFKLMIGQQFAIKAGVDVSSSSLNEDPVTYDFSATGGISFMF